LLNSTHEHKLYKALEIQDDFWVLSYDERAEMILKLAKDWASKNNKHQIIGHPDAQMPDLLKAFKVYLNENQELYFESVTIAINNYFKSEDKKNSFFKNK